jgi:hypothetical protein
MSFPRGRGRIQIVDGKAVIVAHCPLCHQEHRYPKGDVAGEDIAEVRRRGFSDEWLPCQVDLPGNYWRVVIVSNSKRGPAGRRPDQDKGAG